MGWLPDFVTSRVWRCAKRSTSQAVARPYAGLEELKHCLWKCLFILSFVASPAENAPKAPTGAEAPLMPPHASPNALRSHSLPRASHARHTLLPQAPGMWHSLQPQAPNTWHYLLPQAPSTRRGRPQWTGMWRESGASIKLPWEGLLQPFPAGLEVGRWGSGTLSSCFCFWCMCVFAFGVCACLLSFFFTPGTIFSPKPLAPGVDVLIGRACGGRVGLLSSFLGKGYFSKRKKTKADLRAPDWATPP